MQVKGIETRVLEEELSKKLQRELLPRWWLGKLHSKIEGQLEGLRCQIQTARGSKERR